MRLIILATSLMWSNLAWSDTVLDLSFGVNGIVKIAVGAQKNYVADSAIQSDGKIVVAISPADADFKTRIALVRVDVDGALDKKFGKNGVSNTSIGVNSQSEKVAILPDGRIVVAGWAYVNQYKKGIVLVMYKPDGTLDDRFADHGVLMLPPEYSASHVRAIKVQPDGKLVIGGEITVRKEYWSKPNDFLFLARVNRNGTLDTEFGTGGVVKTDVGGCGVITTLATLDNGKIIAAGTGCNSSASKQLVVVRYNQNGVVDNSFGNNGFFVSLLEQGDYHQAELTVLSDGWLHIVGSHSMPYEGISLLAVRLRPDGKIDSSFGNNGTIAMPTKSFLFGNFSLILQADGKMLVAAGSLRPQKNDPPKPPFHFNFGVARFLADGQIDSTFGLNGVQIVSLGTETDMTESLILQANGQVIVAGHSDNQLNHQAVLVRFTP